MTLEVKCPTCDAKVTWDNDHPFKPFCSERCKLIDLGDWADEKHAIPVEPQLNDDIPDDLGYDEGGFFKED
ncbi:DNA gyrase inhibitor YacG [Ferrimonas aestuarii]|uniref:DNA gyrase inhibitor YacG n=1 Tax=Ferrimonas aestuarii TaxID=2569539 RepID=A0A4U1BLL4_9GAMM|nr:DNA gyrase inhibitor YacG [Ferrimonas aestuarii]TKB53716.1 DNA gyrase inhibitor YacG [Ferrimonas aestuarii]